ncbi:MAG: hypothetical protein SFU86_16265 [Pirellulaceae bacterium]|nr:hypothetical protein [Pirellulaceae bacterium]
MNAILLTLLTLGGNNGVVGGGPAAGAPMMEEGYVEGECANCRRAPHYGGVFGMMPQTCYEPAFGCYWNSRHMQRYPAFHGTFYRRPYNYRNYFDYPWHAGLHEPTSHFSYHVPGEGPAEVVQPPVPAPIVDPSAVAPRRVPARSASQSVLRTEVEPTPAQPLRKLYR